MGEMQVADKGAHQAGLAALGLTPHHRQSFAPIRALLTQAA
jgi:hypothetical protein